MKKQEISVNLLMFGIGCFLQSATLMMGFLVGTTKQDTWIVVIIAMIATLPIFWMYSAIVKKFPGKNIIEINEAVFGKVLGKIFSILYIFFFLSLCSLNSRDMSDFVVGSLMPETPSVVVLIMFIFVCVYAVRKGVETILRYSTVFVIITGLVLLINSILLIKNMKISNFQPSFNMPLKTYIQGTHILTVIPFSESLVFFMFFSDLKEPAKIKKPLIGGLLIGASTMLLVVMRDIAVLGPMISMFSIPAFDAVRLINVANTLTRMEIVYATILLMLLFFKICILLYATVKAISSLFKLDNNIILAPSVGVLVICFALIVFKTAVENNYWGPNVAPFFSSFFEFVLPAITLLVAAIKGIVKKKEAKVF